MPPPTIITESLLQNTEVIVPAVYTLLSCRTRFHRIGASNTVVWDEAHFGRLGSHHLRREFYFDVHPPLGKMPVGLAGLLSGCDASFEFKSVEVYPDTVSYVAMWVMLATFGVLMVLLAFYVCRTGQSQWAYHLTTLRVLLDVGWLCISRFILLDSTPLFFTFLTVFYSTRFHNEQLERTFLHRLVGMSLLHRNLHRLRYQREDDWSLRNGTGVYTLQDLWDKFGDTRLTVRQQFNHWVAGVVCTIVLPVLVFSTLKEKTPTRTVLVRHLLAARFLHPNPYPRRRLRLLRHLKNMWGGGLLHPHVQTYPVGSNQQQVTCYHYKDNNNEWNILPAWCDKQYDPEGPLRYLKDGDTIRLSHVPTGRNLRSQTVTAPVSKVNYEMSGYGNLTVGDKHDYWQVEIVDDTKRGSVGQVHSLTTRMRFKHVALGCYLRAANAVLPQWGFKQIESHWNDRLPAGDMKLYKSPFLRDFWHLNVAMMTSNIALIPDPDKEGILASKPDWPFLHLGLRMYGWADNQIKYYLMGTPVVWWGSTISLGVALLTFTVYILRWQRKYNDMDAREWDHFLYVGKIAFFGWALHYVTYLHHYLPTLYFAVLMTKAIAFGVLVSILVATFWWFNGVAFGIGGPVNEHWGLK
ncbi:dolichyl-phosphate-mannose-protein mannosyltransferase [Ephemerocybe angulata]|uniref:Dolichyl-phosphate-mannose--protein mannosyltransferase n=1 Tax=Ephemerocybe angulata TaxID=980116 RepID=A0A8H6HNX2_9AGAR|nr:dolichyl-phosphate-mannose-protein mannosyltransferase [Tulosesus angulatus]